MAGRVRAVSARLAAFVAAVLVGSALGSTFTWTSSTVKDANPLSASLVGVIALGGAALLASFAPIGARETWLVCVALAAGMMTTWWLYARSGSSTAALVFMWGWLAGVPAAAALGVWASRRADRASGPTHEPSLEPGVPRRRPP